MKIGGVILAAGASSRMGAPKALCLLKGETFVKHAIRMFHDADIKTVRVVVGPPHGEQVAATLEPEIVVRNATPEKGMLSSIQAALKADPIRTADAIVLALVDHPRVPSTYVRMLVKVWSESGADVVRLVYDGRGGHPVLFGKRAMGALSNAADGRNPKQVLRDAGVTVLDLAVDEPAIHDDFDTPFELANIGAELPSERSP